MSNILIIGRSWWQGCQALGLAFGFLGLTAMTVGCVPSKVHIQSSPEFDPSAISSIAIIPFQSLKTPQWEYGQAGGDVSESEESRAQFRWTGVEQAQRSDSPHDLYSVSDTAAQFITAQVVSALAARSTLRVIGPHEVAALVPLEEERFRISLKALAQEVGERLKVDGVLMGLVRTYREREGTRMGAKPASVGFEVVLMKSADGVVLWKGEFFEEQKPLTQDIVGFFEKSGGFVMAEELAELGVQKVMKTFPVGKIPTPSP